MVYAGYNQLNMDNMLEGYQIMGFNWEYIYINESAAKPKHDIQQYLRAKRCRRFFPV